MQKIIFTIIGICLLFPLSVSDALGLDIDDFRDAVYRPENLPAGTGAKDMPAEAKVNCILNFAFNLILFVSGMAAVLFLIIGAIRYITALGSERKEGAKKTIKFAIIGLLAVIFAYAIVTNIIDLIFRATV